MHLDWTTILASGVVAAVISSFQFVTNRYLGRILDKIEKNTEKKETK